MNKLITTSLIFAFACMSAYAQMPIRKTSDSRQTMVSLKNGGGNQINALWDLQAFYNCDLSINPGGAFAGVCWTGTEFWVARWNTDSLFTLDSAGVLTSSFKVAGVGSPTSGVRAMTYDGVNIYASDNSTTIKIIDPVTKTLNGTIATSTGFAIRSITYDPTADNNNGGFWVSNFNTAIVQIDMAGNNLNTIPQTTHTLNGMYGSAYDNITTGGPYLWVFSQGTSGQDAFVRRIQLPGGAPTFVNHNANNDVALQGGVAGIAGGLCIATNFVSGQNSIIGIVQSNPDYLIAWELNDATQLAVDGALDTVKWEPPYTQQPFNHVTNFDFPADVSNNGGSTLTQVTYNVDVTNTGGPVFNTSQIINNMASGTSQFVQPSSTWQPGAIDAYDVVCTVSTGLQTDLDNSNDTIAFNLFIGDSVFAYDDGTATSSLGIGNGGGGTLGQSFTLTSTDVALSTTFICNGPTDGDSVNVNIYTMSGSPQSIIGYSPTYIFSAADTDGVVLTLPLYALNGGPLTLAPGSYLVGVNEYNFNVTLGTTDFNYRPGLTWVLFGANPWAHNEDYGFKRMYVLRLNVAGTSSGVADNFSTPEFNVYPNPASDLLTVEAASLNPIEMVEVFDISGRLISSNTYNHATQCFVNTAALNNGLYSVRITSGSGVVVKNISIQH